MQITLDFKEKLDTDKSFIALSFATRTKQNYCISTLTDTQLEELEDDLLNILVELKKLRESKKDEV